MQVHERVDLLDIMGHKEGEMMNIMGVMGELVNECARDKRPVGNVAPEPRSETLAPEAIHIAGAMQREWIEECTDGLQDLDG